MTECRGNIGEEAARRIGINTKKVKVYASPLIPLITLEKPVILNEADAGDEVKNLPHFLQL